MSIVNYSQLLSAISDYLIGHLISPTVAATFVGLAEADFNRTLRLRQMLSRAEAAADQRYIPLPSDWLQLERVVLFGEFERPLEAITLDRAARFRTSTTGEPRYYAITTDQLELIPAPAGGEAVLEMVYYAKIPALSDAVQTNWLLSAHPDLYLYGALASAAHYVNDATKLQLVRAEAERIKAEINKDSDSASAGGSPLIMRGRHL